MMMKRLLLHRVGTVIWLLLLGTAGLQAQGGAAKKTIIDPAALQELKEAEAELKILGDSLVNAWSLPNRLQADTAFIRRFARVLRRPAAYNYTFDSLTFLKDLRPSDNSFRMITWPLAFPNGTYRYHGVIIKPGAEENTLYPLRDYAARLDSAARMGILTADNWFGGVYYALAEQKHKKKTTYTLLGWDGYRELSRRRMIDVLRFDEEGRPTFGAPIFHVGKLRFNRIVFEYNGQATMLLNYLPSLRAISFDHLVPPQTTRDGTPPPYTWVPDGSYDYFEWKKGYWEFQEGELFERHKGKQIREAGK